MKSFLNTTQSKFNQLDSNRLFQAFVIFIIILSALTIGLKTHNISKETLYILGILDVAVTVFFAVEILIRYIATNNFKLFFSKGWNIFDTAIVIGSLIPAGGSGVLLARLLRVFRVLRLVSMVPELRVLVNSLMIAIPRMGYIALLMFIIFYMYGTVGSILFEEVDPILWGDVSISMLTLFRVATFEDWTDVMYATMETYPLSWIYYLSFIFLTAFVFLNMMVGTVLEVMSQEHDRDRAKAHGESLDGGEPASRAQIEQLHLEIEELNKLIKQK